MQPIDRISRLTCSCNQQWNYFLQNAFGFIFFSSTNQHTIMSYLPLAMRPLAVFSTNNKIGFMKPKSDRVFLWLETFDGYYCTQNKI